MNAPGPLPNPLDAAAEAYFASVKGSRVLVTGASSGIGRAIAELFLAAGAIVGVHHRKSGVEAKELAHHFGSLGQAHLLDADLTEAKGRDGLVDRFATAAGGLNTLINNAGGVSDYADFTAMSEESWNATLSLNATAPFRLVQKAWPHLIVAKGGAIINVSTVAVRYGGSANAIHYVAAKGALEAMGTAFAKAGAPHRIRVNTLRCGVIATGMHRKIDGYTDAQYERRSGLVPMGRAGRPEEVARMALFLASEAGAFITGDTIAVAGGD